VDVRPLGSSSGSARPVWYSADRRSIHPSLNVRPALVSLSVPMKYIAGAAIRTEKSIFTVFEDAFEAVSVFPFSAPTR